MRRLKKALLSIVIGSALLFGATIVAFASPTSPSSQLTVRVGYFGGPYYEKAVYSAAELESIGTHTSLYTCMDNGGFLRYAEAEGVYLWDIMDAAGVDVNSISKCHFATYDSYASGTDYFKSLGCNTLFWSDRYAFPDLSCYWNRADQSLTQEQLDAVWDTAQSVQTMLSLRDNFKRVADEAPYHIGDNGAKTSEDCFRLLFGQTQPLGINDVSGDSANGASNMAKWVYEIDVELGGTPSLEAEQSQLELKVGSDYRVTVTISAADSAIRQGISQNLVWRSSDPSIVSVDTDGLLTAHQQGDVTITVYDPNYDDLSATLQITVGEAENLSGNGEDGKQDSQTGGTSQSNRNAGNNTAPSGNQIQPSDDGKVNNETQLRVDTDEGNEPQPERYITKTTPMPATELAEKIHSIRVNRVSIDSDTGGVQNWREQAMAEDSVALGLLEEDHHMIVIIAAAVIFLLICGGAGTFIHFKKETKEVKDHVTYSQSK